MASGSAYLTRGIKPGDIIAGKYQVEKILGAGGMGVVLAAHHMQLEERVAIKLLLPEVLDVPEAVTRFAREARAAVKIKSEHVARIIDVGTAESGVPYMVMEYLEGSDLSAWLKQKGSLPVKQAVEFVLQACEAIAEAHSLGIVHRDLKPANLFCILRPDGTFSIKVLDFGISKVASSQSGDSGFGMTKTSAMMGTPFYMSPEQLRSSRDVDARADVWSLGAILYELLAGKVPFDGEALAELCIKIMQDPTPLIRSVRPEVPVELEQVLCRCLEKDREKRYPNVAEMAIALGPFGPTRSRLSVDRVRGIVHGAASMTVSVAPPPASDDFQHSKPIQTEVAWGQTASTKFNRGKLVAVAIFGVVATLGLALTWVIRSHPAASSETPATSIAPAAATDPQPAVTIATTAATVPEPATIASVSTTRPSPSSEANTPDAGLPSVAPTSLPERGAKPAAPNPPQRASARLAASAKEGPEKPVEVKAPAAAPKPNCDPPYTLDDQGRKHFKAECY